MTFLRITRRELFAAAAVLKDVQPNSRRDEKRGSNGATILLCEVAKQASVDIDKKSLRAR
jgi:hypothetical protein